MLLRASRTATSLSKLAANVPTVPGLTGPNGATMVPGNPRGTMSDLQRVQVARNKLKALMPMQAVGYSDAGIVPQTPTPHGTEGRLRGSAAPRNKLKKIRGPRQYGPRISAPSP